jgi:hypothetical protein
MSKNGVWTRSPPPACPNIIRILSDPQFVEECSAFKCGDYVLRKHPPSFARPGHPQKYESYWRGPFLVISRRINPLSGRYIYVIRNLVSQADQEADTSQLKAFLQDVELFHRYCLRNSLERYLPAYVSKTDKPNDDKTRVRSRSKATHVL